MKRVFFLVFTLLYCITYAQHYVFYGLTQQGGAYNSGVLFKYDPIINKENVEFNFGADSGSLPNGKMTLANNGLLYGVTSKAGKYNFGTLFSFSFLTNKYHVLYNFDSLHGWPSGDCPSLVQAKNGLLYGVAFLGGTQGNGVLYSFNPITDSQKVLYNFDYPTGGYPSNGILAEDTANEILYGSTAGGGLYGDGVIYSYSILSNNYNVLLNLNDTLGDNTPGNDLFLYNDSILYCLTYVKAKYNRGALLRFDLTTGKDTVVLNFKDSLGETPQGNDMMMANNGLIYGLVDAGGRHHTSGGYYDGVIFSLNPITNNYSSVFLFDSTNGSVPEGVLIQNPSDELLYGVTQSGGSKNEGIIYSYDILKDSEKVLYSFNSGIGDGDFPSNGMTLVDIDDTLTGMNRRAIKSEEVKVFPNPSNSGLFQLAISNYEVGIKNTVEVYNEFGQKVYNKTLHLTLGGNTIDLSNLPSGIYLYRVVSENGTLIGSGKLLIER